MSGMKALWTTALCALALAASLPALAATADSASFVRMSAAVTAHDGAPFLAGVEMQLEPGWKTYWKHPGDSGIAPAFDWSESENIEDIDLSWPAPRRFDDPGDVTFGYLDRVTWPLRVQPVDAALPAILRLSMSYGVCSDTICVPREAALTLTVPPAEEGARAGPSVDLMRLVGALAHLPRPLDADQAVTVGWRDAAAPVLEIEFTGCAPGCPAPQLIVDGPEGVWFGTPSVRRVGDVLRYSVEVGALSASVLEGERLGFIFAGPEEARIAWHTMP